MYSIYDNKTGKKTGGSFPTYAEAEKFIANLAYMFNCGTARWKIVEQVKTAFNF